MFLAASVATRRAPPKHHRGARRRIPVRRNSRLVDTFLIQGLDLIASACASPDASKEADASTFAAFWSARASRYFLDPSLDGKEAEVTGDSNGGGCGGFKENAVPESKVLFDDVGNPAILASNSSRNIDEELLQSFDQLLQAHRKKDGLWQDQFVARHSSAFAACVDMEPSLALIDSDDDDEAFQLTQVFDSEDGALQTPAGSPLAYEVDELDAYLFSSNSALAVAYDSHCEWQDKISRLHLVQQDFVNKAVWVGPGPSLTCDDTSPHIHDITAESCSQVSDFSKIPDHLEQLDNQLAEGFSSLAQASHDHYERHGNPATHICGSRPRFSLFLDLSDSDSDTGYADEMKNEDFYGDIDLLIGCNSSGVEL